VHAAARAQHGANVDTECLALAVAADKQALRERFDRFISVLTPAYRKLFLGRPTFDFENKRLIGTGGYWLQWHTRNNPDAPESYENQQTSIGRVSLEHAINGGCIEVEDGQN